MPGNSVRSTGVVRDRPELDDELQRRLPSSPSYLLLTGRPLLDDHFSRALVVCPRVIVAHGTEADPLFFYANRLAAGV